MCRKQGVTELTYGTLSFKLGDKPDKTKHVDNSVDPVDIDVEDPYAGFPDMILTPEDLSFLSNGGDPKDLPSLRDQK